MHKAHTSISVESPCPSKDGNAVPTDTGSTEHLTKNLKASKHNSQFRQTSPSTPFSETLPRQVRHQILCLNLTHSHSIDRPRHRLELQHYPKAIHPNWVRRLKFIFRTLHQDIYFLAHVAKGAVQAARRRTRLQFLETRKVVDRIFKMVFPKRLLNYTGCLVLSEG